MERGKSFRQKGLELEPFIFQYKSLTTIIWEKGHPNAFEQTPLKIQEKFMCAIGIENPKQCFGFSMKMFPLHMSWPYLEKPVKSMVLRSTKTLTTPLLHRF